VLIGCEAAHLQPVAAGVLSSMESVTPGGSVARNAGLDNAPAADPAAGTAGIATPAVTLS
jgi:hypothetical protein